MGSRQGWLFVNRVYRGNVNLIILRDIDDWSNRQCNTCTSTKNVREITFKKGVSGTVIALCTDCRDDLMNLLLETKEKHTK